MPIQKAGETKMDAPAPDSSGGTTRHAYRTAQYQVSKQEMAALYRRYYVWSAAREKDAQPRSTSVTNISSSDTGSRRAYQTLSYACVVLETTPKGRSSTHTHRPLFHHHSKPGTQRHAYQSTAAIHYTAS